MEGKDLDKTIYDTETLHVITQFWNKHKSRLVLNEQDILIYQKMNEEKVIFRAHDQEAHQGVNKVTARIQQKFIWPGRHSAKKKWIKSCHVCQIKKGKAKIRRFPYKIGFQNRESGYTGILVMIDHYTKLAEAIPCMDYTAEKTCNILLNHWISRYGTPTLIQSDNGVPPI